MEVGSPVVKKRFYIIRRSSEHVTPQAFLGASEEFGLCKLHFQKQQDGTRMGQASLEFDSAVQRRHAHAMDGSYIADMQLQLHYSSQRGLS